LNLGVVRERDEVTVLLAVDGLVLAKCVGADVTLSGLVNELFVGSSTLTRYMSGYFIRNLQIAGRPPIFEAHPLLRKIVLWGDSLAGSLSYGDGIMYDNMTGLSFLRKLAKLGIYPGAMVTQSYGGYAFGNYTGMSAIPLSTTLSALEDQNPSVVLIRGGTNDMVNGRYNNTEMRNSIASIVDTILGWNSTVRVVIASIPTGYFQTNLATYTAAHAANRAQISAYFNEMTLTRPRLHYVDTYTAFGGENPLPNTFVGQQNGLLNNLHFAARGGLIQGEDFAEGVLTILNEIGRAPELSQQSWPVQDSRLV
jgi:lysophospholipase L1-like esterase